MPTPTLPLPDSRKRTVLISCAAFLTAAVLFWFFPLFHVVPLQAARQQTAEAAFNANTFVEKLWNLQPSPNKDAARRTAADVAMADCYDLSQQPLNPPQVP